MPFIVSIHRQPLSTFSGEWWAAALWTLSFVYLLWTRKQRTPMPAVPPVVLFPLALALVTAVQFLWIRPFQNDLAGLTPLVFLLGAATILCGYLVRARDEALHAASMIAWALLAASLLGVAAQVVQLFRAEFSFFGLVSEYFPTEQRRLWGNLNQPNHQATVHGLGLAALVYLAAARRLRLSVALVPAVCLVFGIILTGSRTGVVHLGLATLLGLMLAGLSWEFATSRRRRAALVFFSLALVPMYFFLQPLVLEASREFGWKLFDAVARLEEGDAGSARAALWRHAWMMFMTHPWFGVGWMEFGIEQWRQLRSVGMTVELAQQAHNQVLDLLAKTGTIGAGSVLLTLGAWFWRVLRMTIGAVGTADRARRPATLLGLSWLAMLCAHSMLEYPLHYLYFFLLFCFLLGWLEPGGWPLRGIWGRLANWRGWAVVCAVVGGAGLAAVMIDYQRAEDVTRAATFNPTIPVRPRFWFRDIAEQRQTARMPLSRANAAEALARHLTALRVLPTPSLIQRTALLTAMQGDTAAAQRMIEDLRFYYWINPVGERFQTLRLCATLPAAERPQPYCTPPELPAGR